MLKYWSTFEPEYWEVDFANGTPFQDSPQRRDTVFAGATGYEAGECAVDLVYNLSKEMLFEGGLPYILGTENKRRLYRIVSYYFLYYGENVSEIDNEEIEYLATLDEADALRNILSDYRWTSQSNRIWQNSRTLNWGQWKEEKWFGSFMDKYFPWVFHSELGWVYIEGTTQKGFWFYSSKKMNGTGQVPNISEEIITKDRHLLRARIHGFGFIIMMMERSLFFMRIRRAVCMMY